MSVKRTPAIPAKSSGPGRPKDLGKRAAILGAATRLFIELGFDGVSMDQIATAAGVSKLTVYSHFGDKETLFVAAARSYCEQQVPSSLFTAEPGMPVRERLLAIARAFYAMISSPEAIAGHRFLCSPQMIATPLPQVFWEGGPMRMQSEFAALLDRRVAAGELDIPDTRVAAAQFFSLVKGEPYNQLVFGCCTATPDVEAHLRASIDLFLRAYAHRPHPIPG